MSEGYKETEIGVLPQEWDVVPFGNFATLQRGYDLPVQSRELGQYPIMGSNGIAGYHASYAVKGPGVGVGRSGSVGMANWISGDYWPLNTVLWVKDFHGNDPEFVYYKLLSFDFSPYASGVSVPTLNRNLVHPIPISVPSSLKEQKSIAHILRSVQTAREATTAIIEATQELKRSLMAHLFTYGVVSPEEAGNVALKEMDIGEIPEGWEVERLGSVCEIVYGAQAAVAHLKDSSIGIPILTNVNITLDGRLDLQTLRYYEVEEKKRERLILEKGDILFNWRSGSKHHVGKVAIFDKVGEFTFSSFILRFRVSSTVHRHFLYFYLSHLRATSFFIRTTSQSSVNSVYNASTSAEIPVALPTHSEQESIASILESIDAKLAAEQARKTALSELFRTLLHDLMIGRVRVQDIGLAFTDNP